LSLGSFLANFFAAVLILLASNLPWVTIRNLLSVVPTPRTMKRQRIQVGPSGQCRKRGELLDLVLIEEGL